MKKAQEEEKRFPVYREALYGMLPALPGSAEEQDWLKTRLETLTAKESVILTAMIRRIQPQTAADAINRLLNMDRYKLRCNSEGYVNLGLTSLCRAGGIAEGAAYDLNLYQAGREYEAEHPGAFVGNYFVEYPPSHDPRPYNGHNLWKFKDNTWAVKLLIATEGHPEGVWIRTPDFSESEGIGPADDTIAFNFLGIEHSGQCRLLEAKCILPQAGNLMEQYDDAALLIYHGMVLGLILDEATPALRMKLAAAMEYENCDSLVGVLNVGEHLGYYEFAEAVRMRSFAKRTLARSGLENLPYESVGDLEASFRELLKKWKFQPALNGRAYIARSEDYPWDDYEV